jgi:hypothetical protein
VVGARGRIRSIAVVAGALALVAAVALPGAGASVFSPWTGANPPFICEIQDVGQGIDFPDPDADPFCVEYDKTQQNVLPNLGIVKFLLLEPARTAAAVRKCFYFQRDHWTGSVVQDQKPELWHWDGNYFFDRAYGFGGVSVRNLRIGGVPIAVRSILPPAMRPYAYPTGGGGVFIRTRLKADPTCYSRVDTTAEQRAIYVHPHHYLYG